MHYTKMREITKPVEKRKDKEGKYSPVPLTLML